MNQRKNSPLKNTGLGKLLKSTTGLGAVTAGVGLIGGIFSAATGSRSRRDEQRNAQRELDNEKAKFKNLSVVNPYKYNKDYFAGIQNTYEDLTVNQKQAQFEAEQGAKQRVNLMQNLRAASGASGVAGLTQVLANQGALQTQRISASIGAQEARINLAKAAGAERLAQRKATAATQLQTQRSAGEQWLMQMEADKQATILGMAQQRTAAANAARQQATSDLMSVFGGAVKAGGTIAAAGLGE